MWCGVSVRACGARGVRSAVRCGVSVRAVCAVRAVRCFVTLAVSAPRAVRAVRAVRCFVTPKIKYIFTFCSTTGMVCIMTVALIDHMYHLQHSVVAGC